MATAPLPRRDGVVARFFEEIPMGHKFAEIAFTDTVREIQHAEGSREGYRYMDADEDFNHALGPRETEFIAARDSFYMASVGETGWPYLQHRGGPPGFVRVLDPSTLGFADFRGNRQYISVGNLKKDNRVALFFMDYPNRTRLKLLGRVQLIGAENLEILSALEVDEYRAQVERGFLIQVEAFDWNCPQHITPRYSEAQMEAVLQPLREQISELQQASGETGTEAIGTGPLALKIRGIRQLTPAIRAYELQAADSAPLPPAEAGSHLQVPVLFEDGHSETRAYSVFQPAHHPGIYEIAVQLEADGHGGSRRLQQTFQLGTRINCTPPQNNFALDPGRRPAVLIAGGIGITPLRAMAQTLKARGVPLQLHYAGRSRKEMAFINELEATLGTGLHLYSRADNQRLDLQAVLEHAPANAVFYVCGPPRLVDAVMREADAVAIDPVDIHVEHFSALAGTSSPAVELKLKRSGRSIRVNSGQNLLDALLNAGIDAPYSCRSGVCGTCAVKVLEGRVNHRDSVLSEAEHAQQGLMCPCISTAAEDSLTLDL